MCGKEISSVSDATLERAGAYVTDNVTNCVRVCAFIIRSLSLFPSLFLCIYLLYTGLFAQMQQTSEHHAYAALL